VADVAPFADANGHRAGRRRASPSRRRGRVRDQPCPLLRRVAGRSQGERGLAVTGGRGVLGDGVDSVSGPPGTPPLPWQADPQAGAASPADRHAGRVPGKAARRYCRGGQWQSDSLPGTWPGRTWVLALAGAGAGWRDSGRGRGGKQCLVCSSSSRRTIADDLEVVRWRTRFRGQCACWYTCWTLPSSAARKVRSTTV